MRNSVLLVLALVSALIFSFALVAKSAGAYALSTGIDDIVLDAPSAPDAEAAGVSVFPISGGADVLDEVSDHAILTR